MPSVTGKVMVSLTSTRCGCSEGYQELGIYRDSSRSVGALTGATLALTIVILVAFALVPLVLFLALTLMTFAVGQTFAFVTLGSFLI